MTVCPSGEGGDLQNRLDEFDPRNGLIRRSPYGREVASKTTRSGFDSYTPCLEGSAQWWATGLEPQGYGNVGRSIRHPSALECIDGWSVTELLPQLYP